MKTLRILAAIALLLVSAGRCTKASAVTLTNLHSFSPATDGSSPQSTLIQGSDGFFYGTAFLGGSTNNEGTVFKVSPAGVLTPLHAFGGDDGALPQAALVQGTNGNFYGTTTLGGTNNNGTVFQITPAGTLTTLYQFGGIDGSIPIAGLVQGSDGFFYGVTAHGGTNMNCGSGCGTAFKINSSGSLTTLHQFNGTDGSLPEGTLLQGGDGNFYGTTSTGGTNAIAHGTVFRMTPSGTVTLLHSFGSDGNTPIGGVIQGTNGSFYGTTQLAPSIVYQITSAGTFTALHQFNGADGFVVQAGLVQGSDGNLYGTTVGGGSFAQGTVYQITSSGTFTSLFSFSGGNGSGPYGSPVQGYDGNFYGTTYQGGASNAGIVFQLSVPLSPPANQVSGINVVGTNVVISVPSVAGETYQLQSRISLTAGNWANVAGASNTNSIGGLLTLTDVGNASSSSQLFYRIAITP